MFTPKQIIPLITILLLTFWAGNQFVNAQPSQFDEATHSLKESTNIVNQSNSSLSESSGASIKIRLQQAVFDPLQGPPPLPPQLTGVTTSLPASNYYFVQFKGPILADWRADLERQGAVIMDYVPDFTYIVRMDDPTLAQVQTLSPVRWVGLYQPAFRLSHDLSAGLTAARADTTVELIVRAFAGEPIQSVAAELTSRGATILAQNPDSGGGAIFRVIVAETAVVNLAHIPAIAWIEPYIEPALFNEVARSSTIMDQDQIESGLGLYGANQVVAVGDTGLDTGNPATVHQDFAGRVVGGTWGPGACGTWADNHSHGTHVAGSVLGSGFHSGADIPNQVYTGSNAGIAPEAELYVWSFCNDFSGLPAAPYVDYYGAMYAVDSRLRINTNSWGYTSGHGEYNTFTRETDRFVWDNPDMVLVYAAGNDGTDGNSDGVIDFGSMNMPATGKNVLTVGASENLRLSGGLNPGGPCSTWGTCWPGDFPANPINSDRLSDDVDGMAAFSGRGPTLSNRLKPDVVAPGTNIVSTRNYSTGSGWGVYDANYLYMGGTSMATPLVAGASAIVRDFYATTYSLNPGAALVKATLINGAYDMTPGQYGAGSTQDVTGRPDNNQGWGRVDLPNSLIYTGLRQLWFHEHSGLNTGGSYQMTFDVFDSGPFRATLVWVDFQGTEASHGALVNDLDLEVEAPDGTIYLGNEILNPGNPDRTNNAEGVDLMPTSGVYTVTVRGFNVPQGPQPFALVVTADIHAGPVGYLTGLVDDGVDPIVGATVTAVTTTISAPTNGSGIYTMTLPIGSYDVTASAAGYMPAIASNVTILSGTTTIQDFSLVTPPPPDTFTVCRTPNLPIPDGNPAGIDDTLTFTQAGIITDLNLYVSGTHTWVGDLRFILTHPNGSTSVTAIDRPGVPASPWGCGDDDFDVWLDDEGTDGPVEDQCASPAPALYGQAMPNNPLSAFDGLAANGDWILNVSDHATSDPGTLQEWCIEVSAITNLLWRGIENSDWNNPQNWSGGIVAGSSDSVILDPAYLTGANAWPVLEMDPTVENLTLEAGAELIIPNGRSLTINGTLTNNGLLRQTINDVNSATTFLGMGGYGGVEINPDGNMGITTVEIRGHQDCTTDPSSQAVQRCFDIAPTSAQDATIRFYYLPAEANGNPEAGIGVYHWNGSSWDLETGTHAHSTGANPRWVEVTGVSDYSPFVLDDQTPTAVSLTTIGVGLTVFPIPLLLLLLAVLGTAVSLLRRRRPG